jgi:hypothetical protein
VVEELSPKSSIEKLMSGEDADEVRMILDMEYCDWQGQIDLQKIILEMGDIKEISEVAMTVIVEKLTEICSDQTITT